MKWRVVLELVGADGTAAVHEVSGGAAVAKYTDPTTLAPQIDKLKQRFGLSHVVLVGDRGMITEARITEDIKSPDLDWITRCVAPPSRTC
jgi:hypothetical protein